MALDLDAAIRLTAQVQGANNIKGIASNLQQMNAAAQLSGKQLDQLRLEAQKFGAAAGGSINAIRQQRQALDTLRNAADPASRRFQLLTRDIDQLDARLRRLAGASREAGTGLKGALSGAAGAAVMGGGPGAAIGALGGSLAASGGAAGLAAAGGLAAAAGLTVASVANARELEAQTRRLRVMTEQGDALQQQIVALTREQGHLASTTEATAAAYDILQAGFSNNADILQILRAATLGATAGFTDITTVADATTSILNGFGMSASEAGRVVDQMKATTDDGKISMEAYAQSIGRVVPSAAAARVSFEEVNAAISALTAQGVPVETTFSGINQMIKTIIKPTKEASDLAAALGLQFNAQALAAKGLGGFLEDVAAKTGKSTDALSILFSDIDGYKAVVGLLNDDLQRFNRFTDNQADALGRAAAAAEKAIDPLKRFDNAWKDFSGTLGKIVLPALNATLESLTELLQKAAGMDQISQLQNTLRYTLPEEQRAKLYQQARQEAGQLAELRRMNPADMRGFDKLVRERYADLLKSFGYQSGAIQAPTATRPAAPTPALTPARTPPPALAGALAAARGERPAGTAGGSTRSAGSSWQPSSRAKALMAAANKLGVSPLDLATIISFETSGTFNPSLFGGAGGRYMGLIQFGPPERQRYGARPGQSFEEQVTGPVVRYFQDRFAGAGMSTQGASLLDLYTTVLAGNPRANRDSRDSFGTSPRSGVAAMGPHRQKALQTFFGGSMANIGWDAASQAQAAAEGFDERMRLEQERAAKMRDQLNAAQSLSVERERELHILEATDELEKRRREYEVQRLERIETYRQAYVDALSDQERGELMQAQADEARRDQLVFQRDMRELEKAAAEKALEVEQRRLEVAQQMSEALAESMRYMRELSTRQDVGVGLQQGAQAYADSLGTMRDATAQLTTEALGGLEGVLTSLATTGKANYQEFAASVLKSTAQMIIQQLVMRTLLQAVGAIGGGAGGGIGYAPADVGNMVAGFPTTGFSFAGGGYTGDAPRAGGLDGQGGFLAMLHPQETVIDHHKGQGAGRLEGALASRATTGKINHRESAAAVLKSAAQTIIQQPMIHTLLQAVGAAGGAMLRPQETVIDHHKGQGVGGLGEVLTSLAATGKVNHRESAAAILQSAAQAIIQKPVMRTLPQALGVTDEAGMQHRQGVTMPKASFAGGGYTGDAPRAGGLDGQGGFLAMLHPRETVVDHHKGQGVSGSPTYVTVTVNTTTGQTTAEASDANRRQLGRDLAAVVDARLAHHKRPGGLLHPDRRM